MTIKNKVILRFEPDMVEKPILYHLVKEYDLIINIIKADINPDKEGYLIIELQGENPQVEAALIFLKESHIDVEPFSKEIIWLTDKCTQCGACTGVCPTQALYLERPSMEVSYDNKKCIACELCIKVCPVQALKLNF